MGSDFLHPVGISDDFEVEAPRAGHTGLPKVLAFVVLLGVQGGVAEILEQEQRLLVRFL
jgi:hypothetical protein